MSPAAALQMEARFNICLRQPEDEFDMCKCSVSNTSRKSIDSSVGNLRSHEIFSRGGYLDSFCCFEGITHLSCLNRFFRRHKEASAKMQPLGILAGIYATYDGIKLTFITHRFPTFGMVVQSWTSAGSNMLANSALTQGSNDPICLLAHLVPTGLKFSRFE